MRCIRPLLAAAILFGLAACNAEKPKPAQPPAAAATAGEQVGTNAEIDNGVEMRSPADQAWRGAVLEGPVRYADEIRTLVDSRLVVTLIDNGRLTVGPDARITVDRFIIDTRAGAAGAAVSVTRGAFRFVSGRHEGAAEPVSFQTPLATIGIRGTILEGVVGPDALTVLGSGPAMAILSADPSTATLVILREGVIEVRIGQTVIVLDKPGQAIALAGGRWSQPFMLGEAAGGRLDSLLAPRGGPAGGPPVPTDKPPTATPPRIGPAAATPVPPPQEPTFEPQPATENLTDGGLRRPRLRRPTLQTPGGAAQPAAEPLPADPGYVPPRPRRQSSPGDPLTGLPNLALPPAQPARPPAARTRTSPGAPAAPAPPPQPQSTPAAAPPPPTDANPPKTPPPR